VAGRKLDTVRLLLAKAERAATPEEAAAYTAKAAEIAARHGIDTALLAAAGAVHDEIAGTRVDVSGSIFADEKAYLAVWVARAADCRTRGNQNAQTGKVTSVTLYGHASDRERAVLLYTSLLLQAMRLVAKTRPRNRGESLTEYRRSWLRAFAVTVGQRLQAAKEDAVSDHDEQRPAEPSAALVLAGRRAGVDRAYARAYPNSEQVRMSATLSGDGARAGARAGRRASLDTATPLPAPDEGR
jgi:uncharacterized protein DUF2786